MGEHQGFDATGVRYFFTAGTYERRRLLTAPANVLRLQAAFHHAMRKLPFELSAIVVLPDHLHCIWTLPAEDEAFSLRWRLIKRYFSRGLNVCSPRRTCRTVWEPGPMAYIIRDQYELARHLDYVHFDPVRHGYVDSAGQWRFSSFHRFVREGRYDRDWGSSFSRLARRSNVSKSGRVGTGT